ncbi:MAG: glycosyltransferase family 2 protein [Acidobacteriota bacterium]|nr:glycosyltransferase family 2 protein [Acidobacteriota bacterium]
MAESDVFVQEALRPKGLAVKVSVIIPVWNGHGYLAKLLASIQVQTVKPAEVLVIDNGSVDGAAELAERWGARVIRLAENQGFAAAVNRGIEESSGEVLAILNSDVELHPEWLNTIAGALSGTEAWFATGKILSARNPGKIDGTWDLLCRGGIPWRAGYGFPADFAAFQEKRRIDLAPFTAVLVRQTLFQKAGLLDARFESYLEDVDFGLRCAVGGWRGLYVPEAVCRHHGSATLGRWHGDSVYKMSRNQVFLLAKHYVPGLRRHWWWKILIGQLLWGLVAVRHGAGTAWIHGKWDGIRRFGTFDGTRTDLRQLLSQQEDELLALQRQGGPDRLWSLYFRLTRRAAGTK